MSGRILQTVAALIINGLKKTPAAPLIKKIDLNWLTETNAQDVPLTPYRQILDQVFQHYGPLPILQAGESLRGISHPILFVLLNTADPKVLIEKEQRLSRFIHSKHRVNIIASETNHLILEHTGTPDLPLITENLASCGQHIVLLEEIGCKNLRLRLPHSAVPNQWIYKNGQFTQPVPDNQVHCWLFEWDHFEATRKPMDGLDDMLLQTSQTRELSDDTPVTAIEKILLRDLGQTWKINTVARHLGRSARTLQRQLATAGKTFTDIVTQVRTTEAARLLKHTDLSITEIGYICGFADTAHFSRTFKKQYDVTPSQWQRH